MRFRHAAAWAVLTLLGAAVSGCGSSGTSSTNADNFGWIQSGADYAPPGEGGFNVRWSKQLTDRWEARYLPVELSGAAFDVKRERGAAFEEVARDETLLGLFPDTKNEIVESRGDRRTMRSHYQALGQEGTATFHFEFDPGGEVRFEKVCDGRVWTQLAGRVTFRKRGAKTRVRIEMDGRTKPFVPEFTIRGAI